MDMQEERVPGRGAKALGQKWAFHIPGTAAGPWGQRGIGEKQKTVSESNRGQITQVLVGHHNDFGLHLDEMGRLQTILS